MVRPKSRVSKVLAVGPLVPFTDEFTSMLKGSGYAPLTIVNELRLMAHLSRWMQARDLTVVDLSPELLVDYLASVRAGPLHLWLTLGKNLEHAYGSPRFQRSRIAESIFS